MLVLASHQPGVAFRGMAPKTTPPARLTEQQALGKALRLLRKRADMTQEQAADAYGVVVNSWRRYEWGQRDLSFDQLAKLAEAVQSTREELIALRTELLGGEPGREQSVRGNAVLPFPTRPQFEEGLPIRDRVRAGAWYQADDTDQEEPKRFPAARDGRYPHADQWMSEVEGDSANRLGIHSGDLVHCVDAIAINYQPTTDDIVEVERLRFGGAERELTIKQIEVTADGVLLWPRSTNAKWQQPLVLTDGVAEGEEIEVRIRAKVISFTRRL
ncbi:MAG TPA: helix-turn-helix domain-containing protein [Brevundimonas sp.]|nr:helix-turn-helix domain-containing protein [Brevundimonas sp.]